MSVRGEKDMKSYVYIDLVFLLNVVVDYLILLASGKIGGYRAYTKRLLLASVLGSLYATSSFVLPIDFFYSFPFRLTVGFLMVVISYPSVRGIHLIGLSLSFFLCSAITGGVALTLYTKGTPVARALEAGFLGKAARPSHFWTLLVALMFISGLPLVLKIAGSRSSNPPIVSVELVLGQKRVPLMGLVDTGNELRDPVSGLPVVVVDMESIAGIIPPELNSFFSSSWDQAPRGLEGTFFEKRLRLIPYSHVGGKRGVLPGFKPDYLLVNEKDGVKCQREVVVGVSFSPLSRKGVYQALLHPEIVRP